MKIKPIIGTLILLAAICLPVLGLIPVSGATATYLTMGYMQAGSTWNFQGQLRRTSSPFTNITNAVVEISCGTGPVSNLTYVVLSSPHTNHYGMFAASSGIYPWNWMRAKYLGNATWSGCEYYIYPTSTTTTNTIFTTSITASTTNLTVTTKPVSITTTITIFLTSTSSMTITIGVTTAAFTITSPTTFTSTYTVFSVSTSTSTYWTDMTNTITSLRTYTSMTATPLTVTATQVTTSHTTTTTVATSTTTVPFNVQDPTTTYAILVCVIMVIAFAAIFTFRQKTGNV